MTTAPDLERAKNYSNDITFTYPAKLPPGLYQVRVAARDDKSGRIGSAHAWIEIPDLAKKKLTMSTLLLGERTQAMMKNVSDPGGVNPVALSASHRFGRASTLRFLIFAYNTTVSPADQKPDVAVQVQVIRDNQPVITTALRKISTDGVLDLTRLPYAAEIPLSELLPGRYLLQVSFDRSSVETEYDATNSFRRLLTSPVPKPWKPTKEQLLAATDKTVRDVIAPNLRVLFSGINPGLYTAAVGHHFARPGNRFWPALYAAGFTDRVLSPFDERELLKSGYGITNVVMRATASADQLTKEEIVAGGERLRAKVLRYRPRVLAVLGVGAYRTAFNQPKATVGPAGRSHR